MKAKIAQNNSQVSEGGITVKPGQDSIHELIICKVNPFVASVTCSRYQIAFKWSMNFWRQLFSIRWDGKYFNGWNCYLGILQIPKNWARSKFYNEQAYVFTAHYASKKCRLKSTTTNGWRHFGQLEQRKPSVLFPIQSEKSPDSGFFTCDPTKKCIMPSSLERLKGIIGRGHDLRLAEAFYTWL